jgi:hypothetical protein
MSGLAPIGGSAQRRRGADAPPVRRDLTRPGSQFCRAQFCRSQSCRKKSSSGSGPGEASGRRIKSPNWRGNKQSTPASIEDFGSAEIGQGAVPGADRAHTRSQIRRARYAGPGTRRQAFEGEAALLRSSILWRPGRPRRARHRQGTRVPRAGRFTFRGGETGRLCHGWGSSSSPGNIPAARLRLPSPGWRPGFRSSRTSESSEAYSGTHAFYGKFRLHIDRRSTENII